MLYFFYTYNFNPLSILDPLLTGEYGFTQTQFSFLFTVQSWGLIVGTLIAGSFCVRFGKKRVLMVLGLIFGIFTLFHIFMVGNYTTWVANRASISGAEGGCQAEIGSAAAMAAAALTIAAGGNPSQGAEALP